MQFLRITALLTAAFALGVYVQQVVAQGPLALPGPVTSLSTSGGVIGQFCTVLSWVFTAAILASILFVLLAAFKYLTSSGDPEKLKTAQRMIIFAAIGVAVAILARTLPVLVGSFLGQTIADPCRVSDVMP